MMIVSRSAWGAQGERGEPLRGPLEHVVVHHTAGSWSYANQAEEVAAVRSIERTHMLVRGFVGIGYSWLIAPSGRIYEGRGWLRSGAHTVGWNSVAHGLCFMGNGETRPATAAQWTSARWLVAEGVRLGAIVPNSRISGHRDHAATACPGQHIYAELHRLRGITTHEEDTMSAQDVQELKEYTKQLSLDTRAYTKQVVLDAEARLNQRLDEIEALLNQPTTPAS